MADIHRDRTALTDPEKTRTLAKAVRHTQDVSDDTGLLSPTAVAAAVAPILDRLRLAIARAVSERARDLATSLELSPPALQAFSMLRNAMPDRAVDRTGIGAVFIYTPTDRFDAAMNELEAKSLVMTEAGTVVLSDRGRESVAELYAITRRFVDELWAGHDDRVSMLAGLARRAVAAAAATGGPAFAVMAPPWEPPDASVAILLAERLTPLRFHRFDAHVAAWRSAGLTAESVQGLPPGDRRDAIEIETNRRAGGPYEGLTPDERFELCAGLGALPN